MNEHMHQPNAAQLAEIEATCACSNVRKATRAVTQLYDEVLQPTGLTANQFTLLVAVALLGVNFAIPLVESYCLSCG